MRKLVLLAAVLLALLLPARLLLGQWGRWGFAAVAAQVQPAQDVPFRWVANPKVPKEVYLYRGNLQVGGYSFESGFYLPLVKGEWGKPCAAPIRPPLEGLDGKKGATLFGMDADQVSKVEQYQSGGEASTRAEVFALLAEDLTDDSKQCRLTVIDPQKERRAKIAGEWAQAKSLDKARAAWQFQAYDPASNVTREILRPFRLEASQALEKGAPLILAQAPANAAGVGQVVGQWDNWTGADALAEALRKVDPNFDPNKPLAPLAPSLPSLTETEWLGLALCGGLLVFALVRGRNS